MKKNIVWLASYPKSGNTWFRSFLSSLLHEKEVDINDIEEGKIYSSRSKIEEILDLDTCWLSDDEIKPLQRISFQYLSNESQKLLFFKIHDAFISEFDPEPIIPVDSTMKIIYFVRNPLDIVISYANHNNVTWDKTIENMANKSFKLGNEKGGQILQLLLTWSEHYISWVEKSGMPIKVVKYEEMLENPFESFKSILESIGINYHDSKIEKAINATSFEKLKKQEEESGFKEKNPNSPKFFNNGKSDTWKGKLTDEQINMIISDHGIVMKKLGYL